MNQEFVLRWAKRLLVYLAGLFCMALGVVFSVKSALGVSPVTCLANVVYQITLTLPGGSTWAFAPRRSTAFTFWRSF